MLISLVAEAYLKSLPNLPDNLIININKSHAHNNNFCQSAVSLSLGSKLPSFFIRQQTLLASH